MVRLKISDSHLTCKVVNKCLNVCERVELAKWKKRWSALFSCCRVSCQCPWKKTPIEKKSVEHLVVTSTLFNSNWIKHARFWKARFRHSSKDFQVICRNCCRSFENAEKVLNLREKKAGCEMPSVCTRKTWTKGK